MKHSLAEDLFAAVMGLGAAEADERVRLVRPLRHMADYKFDTYGGYGPGIKFLETLAIWLSQFDGDERRIALKFISQELIFLSDREIQHAVSLAYQDLVRPGLICRAASNLDVNPWQVAAILQSIEFRALQRRTLFLGLADGARLDQFRRANPVLVHEQFCVTAEPPHRVAQDLQSDLQKWLAEKAPGVPPTFSHFVLVDDFSGSGYTALRQRGDGQWAGKLHHVSVRIAQLVSEGIADPDHTCQVLLYTASQHAHELLQESLTAAQLPWRLSVVQLIPNSQLVESSSPIGQLCQKFHDATLDDKVKQDADSTSSALGFRGSRLPLVLSHNTPNNSVGILWENTAEDPKSVAPFTPLFPRHERHKADR